MCLDEGKKEEKKEPGQGIGIFSSCCCSPGQIEIVFNRREDAAKTGEGRRRKNTFELRREPEGDQRNVQRTSGKNCCSLRWCN